MNYTEILDNIQDVVSDIPRNTFIYDPLKVITKIQQSGQNKSLAPRFLIVTDFTNLVAIYTKTNKTDSFI
jgi:hypothetical protein